MTSAVHVNDTLDAGRIAHIVPGLIPGECGIGDYAITIAKGLAAKGVASGFVVAGRELAHRAAEYDSGGQFPVVSITDNHEAALVAALSDKIVTTAILHYSGYGYRVNGVPIWMERALRSARRQRSFRLVTMFHETWQKREWLSRALYRSALQKRLALRLCRISDVVLTNTGPRARALAAHHPLGCEAIPVFSNVGELVGDALKVSGLAVTFGLGQRRREAWAGLAARLDLLSRLGITAITDIGSPSFELPPALRTLASRAGLLSIADVHSELAQASIALLNYKGDELGKSGVFAAFAAHRLCVINFGEAGTSELDGLVRGRHYLQAEDIRDHVTQEECSRIAQAANDWYRTHDLAHTITLFQDVAGPSVR